MTGPTPGVVALPPGPSALFGRGASTILVLLAMWATVQTTVLLSINPQLAGWYPNHGHIYRDGLPVPHHHPWDVTAAHVPAVPPLCIAPSAAADPIGAPAVAFTPSPNGLEGVTVSIPALGSPFTLPCDAGLAVGLAAPAPAALGDGVHPTVPTPPPRS